MLVITIIMILGLALFCIYASDDMRRKTEYAFYAWCIAAFLFICSIGGVLLIYESAAYTTLIKHEKNKIILERHIQIDTLYSIKKLK